MLTTRYALSVVFLLSLLLQSNAFLAPHRFRNAINVGNIATMATIRCQETIPSWRTLDRENPTAALQHRGLWTEAQILDAHTLYQKLTQCNDSYIRDYFDSSLKVLHQALRLYGAASVICSFNGGKDAVAILHLLRAALAHYYVENPHVLRYRPRVIYFDNPDEFPEILEFVRQSVEDYELEMIAFERGVKFAEGLDVLVSNNCLDVSSSQTSPMAFVLGTRTTDPNAGDQGIFAPSSSYMPPFMRVNPILDWSYGHIWHFLRFFHLPYCSLYDQGYTSLGTVLDTLPCPALAVAGIHEGDGENNVPEYWPAYMLRDYDQERAGRIPRQKAKASNSTVQQTDLSSPESSSAHLSSYSIVKPTQNGVTVPVQAEDESCVSYQPDNDSPRTVGMLVIGDEILKGRTADTNTHAAAKALRKHNVHLKRVVVVSDDLEDICHEIQRLEQQVDIIITSGGVGPTHDDVTIKSVAAALQCDLELHDEMVDLLREKMNTDHSAELTEAQVKMATLPRTSKLRYLSENPKDWPVLQCQNIFILPGVPEFFEKKIENVAEYLSCQLERSEAYKVVLSVDENLIVSVLNKVVENHPSVTIGSYPYLSHPEVKTVITVEGRLLPAMNGVRNSTVTKREGFSSKDLMDRNVKVALDELIKTLPQGSILRVENEDQFLFD